MKIEFEETAKNADGLDTHQHIASHHVRGIPGGAEQTLCGKLVVYDTHLGTVPDAPMCERCEQLDC